MIKEKVVVFYQYNADLFDDPVTTHLTKNSILS
jgi:hypothetical protein